MNKNKWDEFLTVVIGGQSDRQFSIASGIPGNTICYIRQGRQEPNLTTVRALARSQGMKSWEVLRMVDGP